MSKNRKNHIICNKVPLRTEIWLIVDRDEKADSDGSQYNSSLQRGTRPCIVVSNDRNNVHSSVVEIVYVTTAHKTKLPTHFKTNSTPEPSTVLCEAVDSVPKKDLKRYYGRLSFKERCLLNKCLKISLGLD